MVKSLPTSTAIFRDIIEGDFLYIDKTEYVYQLVQKLKAAYFLSRPRRFGKSLLVSMLDSKPITLIGANFNNTLRKVDEWKHGQTPTN